MGTEKERDRDSEERKRDRDRDRDAEKHGEAGRLRQRGSEKQTDKRETESQIE